MALRQFFAVAVAVGRATPGQAARVAMEEVARERTQALRHLMQLSIRVAALEPVSQRAAMVVQELSLFKYARFR